jgi:hypothetical protein
MREFWTLVWDGAFSTLLEFKGLSRLYGRGAQPRTGSLLSKDRESERITHF